MTGYIFGSGGGSGVDISDTTLLQNEALPGKYFYLANGQKVQGTMSVKEATIATPTASEQILVPAGTYAKGDQKIAGVKTQELTIQGSSEQQIITPPNGYYYNKVNVPGFGNVKKQIVSGYTTTSMTVNFNLGGSVPTIIFANVQNATTDSLSTRYNYTLSFIAIWTNDGTSRFDFLNTYYDDTYGWEFLSNSNPSNINYEYSVDYEKFILTSKSSGLRFITGEAWYNCYLYWL